MNPSIVRRMVQLETYRMNPKEKEHKQNCSTWKLIKLTRSPCEGYLVGHSENIAMQADVYDPIKTTKHGRVWYIVFRIIRSLNVLRDPACIWDQILFSVLKNGVGESRVISIHFHLRNMYMNFYVDYQVVFAKEEKQILDLMIGVEQQLKLKDSNSTKHFLDVEVSSLERGTLRMWQLMLIERLLGETGMDQVNDTDSSISHCSVTTIS